MTLKCIVKGCEVQRLISEPFCLKHNLERLFPRISQEKKEEIKQFTKQKTITGTF